MANLLSVLELLILIAIFAGFALAFEYNYGFILISIIGVGILFYKNKRQKQKEKAEYMENIKRQWGKEHKQKRKLLHIKKLFEYLQGENKDEFTIDDITWEDLNMDSVFEKTDHTMTLPGMQYLYNVLKTPKFHKGVLEERSKKLSNFSRNKDICQSIQFPLFLLGKEEGTDIFDYFNKGINVDTRPLLLYTIISFLPLLVIGLFFISRQYAFTALILLFLINNLLFQNTKKKIYSEMETFRYLGNLINCAENIIKIDTGNLNIDKEEIKKILDETKSLRKSMKKIEYNENYKSDKDILVHYINMLILREPKIFYRAVKLLNKHKDEFFKLYNIIGEIDCYIGMASYKEGLNYYSQPVLRDHREKFYLKTEEIYHPLLENPVSSSFELENKGALVTGSNASGKSTFLRAIGINCIFAQSFYFVHGKNYEASYFKLLTSIGTTDNIVKGDSYFMSEAKSLKRIIDGLSDDYPVLCILDEIFRGTNTAERISAALEVLNYIMDKNSCVIAATHDLELTGLVDHRFKNYHFKETIEDKDIIFDYILRDGPCTTRNAIAILEYLDYPREIYENARKGAKTYIM